MKLGEVIQRVQSAYSKGVQSDDTRLVPRHVYSAITTARATIIRQQSSKNQKISQWSYQLLPCIELKNAAVHECPCVPSTGCMILRSVYKIPESITGLDKHLIQYVTTLDGQTRFDEDKIETTKYSAGNKYTSTKPSFLIHNGYLFVTVLRQLKGVMASGLFNDPVAAYLYPSLCGDCPECECADIYEMDFPMEGSFIDGLVKLAIPELILLMKQVTDDRNNNSSDDATTVGGSMIHIPQQQ